MKFIGNKFNVLRRACKISLVFSRVGFFGVELFFFVLQNKLNESTKWRNQTSACNETVIIITINTFFCSLSLLLACLPFLRAQIYIYWSVESLWHYVKRNKPNKITGKKIVIYGDSFYSFEYFAHISVAIIFFSLFCILFSIYLYDRDKKKSSLRQQLNKSVIKARTKTREKIYVIASCMTSTRHVISNRYNLLVCSFDHFAHTYST